MQTLARSQDVDTLLQEPEAVLLKHSTRCPISAAAFQQITEFSERQPDVPVYVVDVNQARDLSDHIAERLDTPHDSPQAFLLVRGTPVWQATHYSITARDLEQQLGQGSDSQGAGSR